MHIIYHFYYFYFIWLRHTMSIIVLFSVMPYVYYSIFLIFYSLFLQFLTILSTYVFFYICSSISVIMWLLLLPFSIYNDSSFALIIFAVNDSILIFPKYCFNISITNTVLGLIIPNPNAVSHTYITFLGNFLFNPNFLNIGSSHILSNSFS